VAGTTRSSHSSFCVLASFVKSTHKPTRAPTATTGSKPTKEPTNRPIADCSIETYYGGLLSDGGTSLRDDVTRSELEGLLTSTHGRVLPYTSSTGGDDVWRALVDLDAGLGGSPDTVRLIYKQVDVPSLPRGTSDTWNREHLWPSSRGVGNLPPPRIGEGGHCEGGVLHGR